MKSKINLVVTVEDDKENSSCGVVDHIKAIELFCKVKNQEGCEISGRKLTFRIGDIPFVVTSE